MSTIASVLEFIEAGDYYSAQQKARTSSVRLLAKSKGTEWDSKAQEACSLLAQTSRTLLEKGQLGSGTDLGVLLMDTWSKKERPCGDEERAIVKQLIALCGPSEQWRKTLSDAVFSWSSKTGSGPAGDGAIHAYLGEILYKEKDYQNATPHLLSCPDQDAARTLAELLFDWSKHDDERETGLGRYAARGTLSYLEGEAILAARVFLAHFLSLALSAYPDLLVVRFPYPPLESPLAKQAAASGTSPDSDELLITKLPSLNFLQLAVKACQVGAGETIDKQRTSEGLREVKGKGRNAWLGMLARYEKDVAWLRKPEAKESTAELGTIYFGIKPPRAGNPMMDMLSGLMGGGGAGMPSLGGGGARRR